MDPLPEWEGAAVEEWAALWAVPQLEIHGALTSTQDRARALAASGCPIYTAVIADEQTAGRGRSGARWVSERGAGLWLSVVLPPASGGHLPLLVGLAVAESVERSVPGIRASIEWPNDVTVDDRKVAGVLCEGSAAGVVAGIGVNTRTPRDGFPAAFADHAAALDEWCATPVSRSFLAGQVIRALRRRLGKSTSRPAPEALQELRGRDSLAGRSVATEQEGPGRALGIADDGALLLERADGRRVEVRAGHVRPLIEPAREQGTGR